MWRVKVCGLTRLEDALFAAEHGADALGFVLDPKSPRTLREPELPSLVKASGVDSNLVGVFSKFDQEDYHPGFDIYQGEGAAPVEVSRWMPVFRPKADDDLSMWLAATDQWSDVLLDPFHATLGGGTGAQLDFGKAAEFVKQFPGRVILAGGISARNVAEIVKIVQPYGVDASSGLETSPGIKSFGLIERYIGEALAALG